MNRIVALAVFVAVCPCVVSADADSELDRKVDELFVLASNPEAHHQHLVEPSREELAQMGAKAVPRLVSKLSTEDARERHALADIFKRIGSPAVPELIEALQTENLYGLRNAARCLGEVGDRAATPALLPLFTHENHTVRSTAVTSVGKCHDSSAVESCISLLSDNAEPVRKSAAVALGRIGDARAVQRLIDAFEDAHYSVRMSAANSLAVIGDDACEVLRSRFDELADLGKYLAFEVWARCKYRGARGIIEEATHSDDSFARAFAIHALAVVDPKRARKRIDKMLRSETDLIVLSRLHAAQEIIDTTPQ
jgi:HEAT repeat protein